MPLRRRNQIFLIQKLKKHPTIKHRINLYNQIPKRFLIYSQRQYQRKHIPKLKQYII